MNEYNAIAGVYDRINSGVDYEKWATFTESLFDKYLTERPELVLDLASGTGRMTVALARRGYDMIGVDRSPEMLSAASDAVFDAIIDGILPEEGKRPLFLCQSMTDFELYGTVGAIVCCLDSLNYLTGDGELDKKFVAEAAAEGLINLAGHPSVGGMCAAIYNSMPYEGIEALIEFMKKFERENPKMHS